ncbi:Rha family transcriptional regulator [Parasutterella excrementihominis]|uniref:Rha family transcriptional regulator n=1 Tax=Parasutterella excrementihominis TaxID=487175 RepID=UPI0024331F8D|nr:Rha family transcriptional regulator [Parasutterella excrementihominis]
MSNSLAFIQNGVAVTSSFIISEGVAIQHKNVLELIKKYISDLKTFGNVLFETQSFKTAGGIQKREIAILNEPQTTLLLTFFKNTEIVRKFKVALVQKFYELRTQLYEKSVQQEDNTLISNEQQYELSSRVMRKTHALFGNKNYSFVYRALKRRFRIPRYTCLLQRDFETALAFVDGLKVSDFNVPDVKEESPAPEVKQVHAKYVVQFPSLTINSSLSAPLPAIPAVPVSKHYITDNELEAIKSLIYYFDDLFKPQIQWASKEAYRQGRQDASRFYDVWHEPLWFISRMRQLVSRNS